MGRQGPILEDFSGEVLPSRSSNRPVRSCWRSGQSDIMPSSTKFFQTRYAAAPAPRQARPHACAHASARAARRRAAPTGRRRPPPRAIAARRAVRRRTARARPGRARRPRAPARESGRHTACGAAVETNLVTFTSASGGVRNALALPHRARTRRRARRARASTRRPPPQHCANSAGAAARGVMSSTADRRSWVGRPVGTDHLCSAVAVVDAMVGLWRAGSAPVVTPREPGDPVARRPLDKARLFLDLAARRVIWRLQPPCPTALVAHRKVPAVVLGGRRPAAGGETCAGYPSSDQ